jgi:hypothetical protein
LKGENSLEWKKLPKTRQFLGYLSVSLFLGIIFLGFLLTLIDKIAISGLLFGIFTFMVGLYVGADRKELKLYREYTQSGTISKWEKLRLSDK